MKRVENNKKRETANKNLNKCPECGSENVESVYESCLCHRTYEGDGTTCWQAPHCNDCEYTGIGNSSGGLWYKPDGWA